LRHSIRLSSRRFFRELGEALTGSQLDRFLLGLKLPRSNQSTKWKRIFESLAVQQATDGHGDSVARFIKQTMAPVRFTTEPERFDEHRERLNLPLWICRAHARN
jgi:hypothetical protein